MSMSDERRSRAGIYVAVGVLIPVIYVMGFVPAALLVQQMNSPFVTRCAKTFYHPLIVAQRIRLFDNFCAIQERFWQRIGLAP